MKILLAGASGFIGRHLTPHLAKHHEVIALVRERGSNIQGAAAEVVQDLARPLETNALPADIDAVIHLAQSEHYRDFPERAEQIFAVNVHGTLSLLEYARIAGAETFIFTSTGGVYGTSYERFAETDPVDPLNFYLSSKYSAELLLANYGRFFRTVVLRPFFVYGPGQSERMLVPRLVQRVRDGEPIQLSGPDGLRLNPIYVGDAIGVFEPALQLPTSDLFNVAGTEVVTLRDLLHTIGEIVGREPVVTQAEGDIGGDLIGDIQKMSTSLGIVPRIDLAEGLRLTAAALASP